MEERSHTDLESSIKELEERAEKWDNGTGNFVLYVPGGCGAICFFVGLTGDFDLLLGGAMIMGLSLFIHFYPKRLRFKKDQMLKALEIAKVEQEKEKEIRARELEENALKKQKELKEKYAHLRTFAKDAEWYSFLAGTVCIGMHRELVNAIKGVGYDEKRTVTSKATKLTYKYQPYLNARKTTSYKLQVTFIDDRVNAFKDL
jgi:hypothetical protein